jgi:hypothetical protein
VILGRSRLWRDPSRAQRICPDGITMDPAQAKPPDRTAKSFYSKPLIPTSAAL